jgi:Flp pilus assembly protein TadG
MSLRDDERGDAALELVLLAPLLVLVLGFVVIAGRVSSADTSVHSAAADAARAASMHQSTGSAIAAAQSTAGASLQHDGLACRGGPAVTVRTSLFRHGGSVSVTVTCTAFLHDVAMPGLPGSRTITANASSEIDTARSGQ